MVRIVLGLICLLTPTLSVGIPYNIELNKFDDYKEVKFVLLDGVKGGCWTNLKEVREYSEEKIKLSGMTLNNDGGHHYMFVVQSNGRRVDGFCDGNIVVGLYTETILPNEQNVLVTIKEIGYTFRDLSFNNIVIDQIGRFFNGE